MEKINWINEKRKISDLNPAPYNPRQMTEKQAEDLGASLDRFSLADPIIINRNNTIIGGHQRINMLKQRGIDEVDVRVPERELSNEEEIELNLRLNKNLGEWDFDTLANFDEDMLKDIGFDGKELDRIFQLDKGGDDDDVPENRNSTDIVAGNIFTLGDHRLLCGDGTSVDDVKLLMGDEIADMIFTDPPYNVDYGANKHHPSWKIRKIENDKMSTDDWSIFCHNLFDVFKKFNSGDIYMWGASGPEGMRMRLWLVEQGAHWSATIILKKQQLVLSPAKYQRMYEPCFYGWFDKSSFNADRKQTEVWEIDRPLNSKLHPTMKPVALCAVGVENSSPRDGIVLDCFGGSGSTIIACESLNRKCRMVEMDAIYCQTIIDRWEKFTGKKAEKIK